MPDLFLHQRKVNSVFSLLGDKENDITSSLGWALARSPDFLCRFLQHVFRSRRHFPTASMVVALQEFRMGGGITDIEIHDKHLHVIVEAKRGWTLPSSEQLKLYVPRLKALKATEPLIVTMSESSEAYAQEYQPEEVAGVAVRHVSWATASQLSELSGGTHEERRLMQELRAYIATIVNMQQQESNWAYVVSLNRYEWAPSLTFIEIVEKRRRYFHPYGTGGWPKEPPNYLAFRHDGRLQSIHHVAKSEVIRNFHPHFPEAEDTEVEPHLLYNLERFNK